VGLRTSVPVCSSTACTWPLYQQPASNTPSRRRIPNNPDGTCNYCAQRHIDDSRSCPAYGQTCLACNRKNHLARCCRSKPPIGPLMSSPPRRDHNSPRRLPARQRPSSQPRRAVSFAEINKSYPTVPLNVDAINDNSEMYPEADISIQGKTFKFLIDTGAPINILDESIDYLALYICAHRTSTFLLTSPHYR
jgi:hypothetical protein